MAYSVCPQPWHPLTGFLLSFQPAPRTRSIPTHADAFQHAGFRDGNGTACRADQRARSGQVIREFPSMPIADRRMATTTITGRRSHADSGLIPSLHARGADHSGTVAR